MRLKKIEIWDFECHKHSVFEDFDKGLNLVFGDSDAGKTSMVRALKLAAYNDFDPNCVRTGAKNCQVYVETERGYVHVTRGKVNIWKTCRKGEAEQEFTKIGKNILQEAAMIIGLHIVSLGDIDLPINIMDQNESHFMLNELAGSNASGSMRAQIIDEISGCAGIEGLIKEVSLDRHRFGRKMKEHEDNAKALRESMHDKNFIQTEEKLLDDVQKLVNDKNDADRIMSQMADIFEEHHEASEQMKDINEKLGKMPNTKILKAILNSATKALTQIRELSPIMAEHKTLVVEMNQAKHKIDSIPDLDEVNKCLQVVRENGAIISKAVMLKTEHNNLTESLRQYDEELSSIPDLDEVNSILKDCENKIALVNKVQSRGEDLVTALDEMDDAEKNLEKAEENLRQAIIERNKALQDVDVCPLTKAPISGECFKGLKFPVLETE
jgi:DNA repair exonuclease SbcCD ATPase subunit